MSVLEQVVLTSAKKKKVQGTRTKKSKAQRENSVENLEPVVAAAVCVRRCLMNGGDRISLVLLSLNSSSAEMCQVQGHVTVRA